MFLAKDRLSKGISLDLSSVLSDRVVIHRGLPSVTVDSGVILF